MKIIRTLKQAAIFISIFTILTGIIYPVIVTAIGQWFFPHQANGSMIEYKNKIVGSKLIGQQFNSDKYFWSRPSATKPFPYNASGSAGSNLGPMNPELIDTIKKRAAFLKSAHPDTKQHIPMDLVTTSASGIDPHISLFAAYYQIQRVANARKISSQTILDLLNKLTTSDKWGIFGMPRVSVLELNLALDKLNDTQGNEIGR